MAEKKGGDFMKKTKSALSEIGSKAAPVAGKASEQIKNTSRKVADAIKKREKDAVADAISTGFISTYNAMKIIYYLMAADGEIFHNEEEKFDSIGNEFVSGFDGYKGQIVEECRTHIQKAAGTDGYYDVIQEGVEAVLASPASADDVFISPKLLVWDMLTVAYSDENYDEAEKRLINYVVNRMNIDGAVFLEMESSMLAVMDIEREAEWIKTTDRQYLTIEAMVKELENRKNVIFASVLDLIAL